MTKPKTVKYHQNLTDDQLQAWNYIHSKNKKKFIRKIINRIRKPSKDISKITKELQECNIRIYFRTINLMKIIQDTHYRNQFETKISNGLFSYYNRNIAENKLFNKAYEKKEGREKVKYGILYHSEYSKFKDSSPYGNHYIVLKSNVKYRSTFTTGDSLINYSNKVFRIATFYQLDNLLNKFWIKMQPKWFIEAQIHGDISLSEDVEKIVIDKSKLYYYCRELQIKQLQDFSEKTKVPIEFI